MKVLDIGQAVWLVDTAMEDGHLVVPSQEAVDDVRSCRPSASDHQRLHGGRYSIRNDAPITRNRSFTRSISTRAYIASAIRQLETLGQDALT
jgi:hypothetical protein